MSIPGKATSVPARSILLIADNPDEETLTLRALRQAKVRGEVAVVHSGAEAIEFIEAKGRYVGRKNEPAPALILVDFSCPHIQGHKLLRQLRAHRKSSLLPIVILMSSFEQQDLLNGFSGGANSYVLKPVDTQRFAEVVHQVAHYWLQLNETPRVED
jgi:two-component system, response regulator